jgi:hypothetical protein
LASRKRRANVTESARSRFERSVREMVAAAEALAGKTLAM